MLIRVLFCLFSLCLTASLLAGGKTEVNVADYLPENFVRDGSVSYQTRLQQALDQADPEGAVIRFPPGTFLLEDEQGLTLSSNLTMYLEGTRFLFPRDCDQDGQAFLGHHVHDVKIIGGEIIGQNEHWKPGTNIRGIYLTGQCERIRISGMNLHDLTSNGIGLFGVSEEKMSRDIWINRTIIDNCCNVYGDYSAPKGELHGPEKGSVREDQGSVAMYYVRDFVVSECRFDRSRSDGTHFYHCVAGQFSDNKVYRSKMGGYFLEGCREVLAANNVIRENGSRGCTIERGSHNCSLIGNVVEESGREGLWIPDSTYCVISDNIFRRNGRKPNQEKPSRIWNTNITINESGHDPAHVVTDSLLVSDNLFETSAEQIAAIRIDLSEQTDRVIVKDNIFRGENRTIKVERPELKNVFLRGNIID